MSEPPANPVFVEFVFLRLKCTVVPEEPKTNLGGQQFLGLMGEITQQHGYLRSAWGRSMENPARVVIMVGAYHHRLELQNKAPRSCTQA